MRLSKAFYSEIGKRNNNEDAVSVLENDYGLLAIVADGVGGQNNGEFASRQAIETLNKELASKEVSSDLLETSIIKANDDIFRLQTKHPEARTTIAAVWIGAEHAVVMNVGDSRIYQIRDDTIAFQSVDHTKAQLAVMVGDIKAKEIRTHKDRNKLLRALGDSNAPKVAKKTLNIEAGDRFLICSDGFWEIMQESDMILAARNTSNAKEWLECMRTLVVPLALDNNSAVTIVVE